MKKLLITLTSATILFGLAFIFSVVARDESPQIHLAKSGADTPNLKTDSAPPDRTNQTRITSYADVLDNVTPAVVGVFTSQLVASGSNPRSQSQLEEYLRDYFGLPGQRSPESGFERKVPSGVGSGVIVSPNGYILTNNHVVAQQGSIVDEVVVKLTDGREFEAKVVGADAPTDVAVLKIEAKNLPTATLTDSDHLRVGDIVFAIGNPLQVGTTVTMGIVSATKRTNLGLLGLGGYENFIQTDASINLGNSGGALVDAHGRLVGINTAIMSRTGGNIGLGFAIPVNLARNIMSSLVDKGVVERGAIGVMLEGMTLEMALKYGFDRPKGAIVREVVKGKAGDKAGLKNGDIITTVDGGEISNYAQLRLIISQKSPGTKVSLDVIRGRSPIKITVILGSLGGLAVNASPEDWPVPGLELESVTTQLRGIYKIPEEVKGVVITSIHDDFDYGTQIVEGTVICEINGSLSNSVAKAKKLVHSGVNRLYIWRKGVGYRFIAIRKE